MQETNAKTLSQRKELYFSMSGANSWSFSKFGYSDSFVSLRTGLDALWKSWKSDSGVASPALLALTPHPYYITPPLKISWYYIRESGGITPTLIFWNFSNHYDVIVVSHNGVKVKECSLAKWCINWLSFSISKLTSHFSHSSSLPKMRIFCWVAMWTKFSFCLGIAVCISSETYIFLKSEPQSVCYEPTGTVDHCFLLVSLSLLLYHLTRPLPPSIRNIVSSKSNRYISNALINISLAYSLILIQTSTFTPLLSPSTIRITLYYWSEANIELYFAILLIFSVSISFLFQIAQDCSVEFSSLYPRSHLQRFPAVKFRIILF